MLSSERLTEIYDSIADLVIRDINAHHTDVPPMLMFFDADGDVMGALASKVIAALYNKDAGHKGKEALRLIAQIAVTVGNVPRELLQSIAPTVPRDGPFSPALAAYVSEAYVSQIGSDELARARDLMRAGVTVEHMPRRTEAVVVALYSAEGCRIGLLPIEGKGAARRVRYEPLMDSTDVRGRMGDGTPVDLRASADMSAAGTTTTNARKEH